MSCSACASATNSWVLRASGRRRASEENRSPPPRRCLSIHASVSASSRPPGACSRRAIAVRSEEHTSELQSLMRISYAVFCLKKKTHRPTHQSTSLTSELQNPKQPRPSTFDVQHTFNNYTPHTTTSD